MRTPLLILLALLAAQTVAAQELPATDIFVLEMPGEQMEPYAEAANLTDRAGYDNQPAFSLDGTSLWFTSIWEDDQADIYRIRLRSGVRQRMTFTRQSEYSPTPLPDGSGFSVVRVEDDGTQRLWKFSMDGREAELLLEDVAPVGYHAWLSARLVALFIVGEPHVLMIADVESDRRDTIATDIGRALHRVPGQSALSYIQKGADRWTVDAFDLTSGETRALATALPGQEDFAWTPDGVLLSADGDVIYSWTPGAGDWGVFLDFSRSPSIGTISRIAVSPRGDTIAFVAVRR